MAWSFDVASNIPRLNQSGTDTGLAGIATAIGALATVARSTAYTTAQMIKPPTPTGFWYRCSTAGTSSATAPTYSTTLGGTTTDGTAVFTAFRAPDVQSLGTQSLYYMPDFRFNITGTLTNANPQISSFVCWDLLLSASTSVFTSGSWGSDGITPLYDCFHFIGTRVSSNPSDNSSGSFQIQLGTATFIGGEVQVSGAVGVAAGTTINTYYTRWRGTKQWGGVTSTRIRSYSNTSIWRQCELFDIAFDRFNSPAEFSAKARKCEYIIQYVGSINGGVNAKFTASGLENIDGVYDFDNYASGWCELYNCAAGANLRVTTQQPTTSVKNTFFTPLFQDISITAKNSSGVAVQDVRFSCTDVPSNSPTTTITTYDGLKTWDYRNPLTYQTTSNASGIATSTPSLQAWWFNGSAIQKNLRFPLSTAIYQGRAYNYKTMNVSVVLGSNSIQDVSAGLNALDTATTVTETAASAITGITLIPQGATGGTIVISSNKTYQDIWNYYRWWISQFANKTSDDVWTCIGGTLNVGNWNIVVNTGVTVSSSTNITTLKSLTYISIIDAATMPYLFNAGGVLQPTGILVPSTILGVLDTYTGAGAITGVYQDSTGTSTVLQLTTLLDGYSLCVYKSDGTTKYFTSNVTAGTYTVYFKPDEAGSYLFAAERYGDKRISDTIGIAGGIVGSTLVSQEDVGISVTNKATVAAYTNLDGGLSKTYDAVAYYRLSETGIKMGQIVARDGTFLDFTPLNVVYNDQATSIVSQSTGTLTLKGLIINSDTKYNAAKTSNTKTIIPFNDEQLNFLIEDANGDSSLTLLGGDNIGYQLWKVTTSTPTDDYATGTLLATLPNNLNPYRFIGISGFDIVGRDISSGVRRRSSMAKGVYTQAFYVGNEIQLATDAPQLVENNIKIDNLITEIQTIKGSGWESTTDTLREISLRDTEILNNVNDLGTDLTADLTIINNGVKKASIFVPHNTSL